MKVLCIFLFYNIGAFSARKFNQSFWFKVNLVADFACADYDIRVFKTAFVKNGGVLFFHSDWRTAATNMTANAADFAGSGCGRRYEKELETHFRDCLLFYLDGRIRFERYCYGEAACLVFSVWAHGFDADGNILWDREPEFESQKTAIPRVLTDIQEDGNALQFDGAFKRYVKTEEFDEDKPNGYGKFKVFWLKRKK